MSYLRLMLFVATGALVLGLLALWALDRILHARARRVQAEEETEALLKPADPDEPTRA